MSASGSAISTAERIAAWAKEERMRLTGRVSVDPRKARAMSDQAKILLKMEGYANKVKNFLESDAVISSVAWHRAAMRKKGGRCRK